MSDVSIKTAEVEAMHKRNAIIDALLGGTRAMRMAGELYLPKFKLEETERYQARLSRATLYPALSESIAQMIGRVFFEPINTEKTSEKITALLENIDLLGNNLDVFSMELFKSALSYGVSYVLVDYPIVENVTSLAEEKAIGARPYFVHIKPEQVLGIKYKAINGKQQLAQFRYQETVVEDDGEFNQRITKQVVVHEIGRIRKYQRIDGVWVLISDTLPKASNKPLQIIPIVPFYTNKTGFYLGEPPLMELAYLNIKHWQSQSDQDNILNTARVPMLWISGVQGSEEMHIGESAVFLPDEGKMGYVEHSGAAISAGQESLKELEEQMKVAGAKLLTKTALSMTDSQARDEQTKEISQLRAMANRLEDSLAQALDLASMWLGIDGDNHVEISGNIDDDLDPNASMDSIMKLFTNGVISRQTAFEETKRRGLISDQLTWEDEQVRLDTEGVKDESQFYQTENHNPEDSGGANRSKNPTLSL